MRKYKLEEYINLLKKNNLLKETYNVDNLLNTLVDNICYNSKEVSENSVYVCKGINFKEEYLKEAISNNALIYVCEIPSLDYPHIVVSDIRKSLAILSALFYDNAKDKLNLIGITGTKGKSTITYYTKSILDNFYGDTAILSSIDNYDGKIKKESLITTPESLELEKHFNNAVENNIKNLVMEVSSQALKLDRTYSLNYKIGVFTNISQDHISTIEHPNFEDYLETKLKLFKQCEIAIINEETDYFERVIKACKDCKRIITFSTKNKNADVYGYDIKKVDHSTIKFKVKTKYFDKEFILNMPGLFNVENALASIGIALCLDVPYKNIYEGLKVAKASGRMELHTTIDESIIAIVDYAHNKLSFEKLYESTKNEYPDKDIITVFGCPGGKAFLRRKDLGLLSGINSKITYLTAEDPGPEETHDISLEIAKYVSMNGEYKIIDDREEAIKTAIEENPNSVILITGKGNETRQKYGKEYLPCKTDTECVLEAFKKYNENLKVGV